jgi:hypothetical protein
VNNEGDWVLWGLDIACDLSSSDINNFKAVESLVATLSHSDFRSPERTSGDWEKVHSLAEISLLS